MNCLECQEELQRLLDARSLAWLSPDVQVHLCTCLTCRDLFAAAERLGFALAYRFAPVPRAAFVEQLVARVLWDQRRRRRRRWWSGLGAAAAAAGMMFWVTRTFVAPPGSRPDPIVHSDVFPQPAQARVDHASLQVQLAEAGEATLKLTRQVAQEAVSQVQVLVPRPPGQPPTLAWEASVPVHEVGRTVATGFEPVADSARRAWNLLLEAIPVAAAEHSGL
jgi:predicted anti-sigma-YlaC factor YlaD